MPGFKYVPADSPVTLNLSDYQTGNTGDNQVFIRASGTVTVNLPAISALNDKTAEIIGVQNGGGGAVLTLVPNAADRLSTGAANVTTNTVGGTIVLKVSQQSAPATWVVMVP